MKCSWDDEREPEAELILGCAAEECRGAPCQGNVCAGAQVSPRGGRRALDRCGRHCRADQWRNKMLKLLTSLWAPKSDEIYVTA